MPAIDTNASPIPFPTAFLRAASILIMLIAEYWTDGPVLKDALERVPAMVLSLEEQYQDEETERFIFWASGDDFPAFEAGLQADPTVENIRTLVETPTRHLYGVTLSDQVAETRMLSTQRDLDLVRLDTEATNEGWTVRMRFPDRRALRRYRRIHEKRGFPFQLRTIYQEADAQHNVDPRLTDRQREALLAAYEAGHFDVPQRATQKAIAADLDIAPQSLSELLRRGTRTLIESTLISEMA